MLFGAFARPAPHRFVVRKCTFARTSRPVRKTFRSTGAATYVIVDDEQVVIEDRTSRWGPATNRAVYPMRSIISVRSEHSSPGVRTLRIITDDDARIIIKMKAADADAAADLIRNAI